MKDLIIAMLLDILSVNLLCTAYAAETTGSASTTTLRQRAGIDVEIPSDTPVMIKTGKRIEPDD